MLLKDLAMGIYETTKFQFYHNTVGGKGINDSGPID
jgi:hypothetical protein